MTQEQLIEFLKENLRLDVETKSVYMGSCGDQMYQGVTTIKLILCDEVISKVST